MNTQQEASFSVMQLEERISIEIAEIAKLKEEKKIAKSAYDDTFANDAQFRELEEKAREATKVKNAYKKAMHNDPAVQQQADSIALLNNDIKERQLALSDYLREYKTVSKMNSVDIDGQLLLIEDYYKLKVTK